MLFLACRDSRPERPLSSRELLNRIGLNEEASHNLLEDESLDELYDGEQESGSAYFHEPLSLVIGLFWNRDPHCGDFIAFHVDGRRFEPWDAETA